MLNIREKIEIIRLGLTIGLFSKDEVIKWVDFTIENERDVDYALIDVSLNSNKNIEDIAYMLKNVEGNVNYLIVTNIIIGLLSKKFNENHNFGGEIANMLYKLIQNIYEGTIEPRIINHIKNIDEGFYLAEQNIYGNLKDMTLELKEFLRSYEKYSDLFNIQN